MSIQVQRKHSGLPCAMALRLMPRSPRRRILACHRHQRISDFAEPGWVRNTSADLTPATGAGTTRFCRTQPDFAKRSAGRLLPDEEPYEAGFSVVRLHAAHRSRKNRPATTLRADAAASTASQPAFVTIANAPHLPRDGRSYANDLRENESGIFLIPGLDTISENQK